MKKILYVDADSNGHEHIQFLLSGYTILNAFSIQEAATILSQEYGVIIVLDLETLDSDKIEAVKRLKSKYPVPPMIVCLNTDDTEDIFELYLIGIDDLILKPFQKELLVESIEHLFTKVQRFKKVMAELL